MSYFSSFPFVQNYSIDDKSITGMNITVRTGFSTATKDDEQYYIEYDLRDGESPEIIADRVYDDATLYWVILMFNDIHDIDSEWPLDSVALEIYIDRIYGDSKTDIHHYESAASGLWVDEDHPEYDLIPITNYEYEIRVNDDKRKIKVPVPEVVSSLKRQHRERIQQ